jgi:hypothetical protein
MSFESSSLSPHAQLPSVRQQLVSSRQNAKKTMSSTEKFLKSRPRIDVESLEEYVQGLRDPERLVTPPKKFLSPLRRGGCEGGSRSPLIFCLSSHNDDAVKEEEKDVEDLEDLEEEEDRARG